MEKEPGLYDFDLTRFRHANRYPLRSKTRSKKNAASFGGSWPRAIRSGTGRGGG